jgi:hypothetical protein
MQEPPRLPLPRLAKGRHKTAGHEACVMELVSFLNEEEWSDHPHCVQPVLAAAARAVNDRVSDEGRQRLVDLAPRLAGTSEADWLVGARLVVLCTEAALNAPRVPTVRPAPGSAEAPGTWRVDRMPHEVWQELTAARRTASYLLARQSAAARAHCPWRVRVTIWLLDRAGLLKRVYPFDAALQVAFAIAQIGSAPEAESELFALLEAFADACGEARR